MKRRALLLPTLLSLVGCAAPTLSTSDLAVAGPSVEVLDTALNDTASTAAIFALTEWDGRLVENAARLTSRLNQKGGFTVRTASTGRRVPLKPLRVRLSAFYQMMGPPRSLLETTGVVDFTPEARIDYVVKGRFGADGAHVWIEELKSGKVVTAVVGPTSGR